MNNIKDLDFWKIGVYSYFLFIGALKGLIRS